MFSFCLKTVNRMFMFFFFFFANVEKANYGKAILYCTQKPMLACSYKLVFAVCSRHSTNSDSTVAQFVEHPLRDWDVVGSIPSQIIKRLLKWYLPLFRLVFSIKKVEIGIRTGQPSVMWLGGILSCIWAMIFQRGSTLNVSIEFPATSRHSCSMTERVLKQY